MPCASSWPRGRLGSKTSLTWAGWTSCCAAWSRCNPKIRIRSHLGTSTGVRSEGALHSRGFAAKGRGGPRGFAAKGRCPPQPRARGGIRVGAVSRGPLEVLPAPSVGPCKGEGSGAYLTGGRSGGLLNRERHGSPSRLPDIFLNFFGGRCQGLSQVIRVRCSDHRHDSPQESPQVRQWIAATAAMDRRNCGDRGRN